MGRRRSCASRATYRSTPLTSPGRVRSNSRPARRATARSPTASTTRRPTRSSRRRRANYRRSSGYGRQYRNKLRGAWGVVDTEDCVNAALHLAAEGEADRERLAIRGGSAGGYAVLCALTFHDVFATGASYFGVADTETMTGDTHKFESRYLDLLIGPYPEQQEVYRER